MYSQPWSAWPRAFQGRFATWSAGGGRAGPKTEPFELPFVTVAIVRVFRSDEMCLERRERAGVKRARLMATTATKDAMRRVEDLVGVLGSW